MVTGVHGVWGLRSAHRTEGLTPMSVVTVVTQGLGFRVSPQDIPVQGLTPMWSLWSLKAWGLGSDPMSGSLPSRVVAEGTQGTPRGHFGHQGWESVQGQGPSTPVVPAAIP